MDAVESAAGSNNGGTDQRRSKLPAILAALIVLGLVVVGVVQGLQRREPKGARVVLTPQAVMGTTAHITVSGGEAKAARAAGQEGYQALRRADKLLSTYQPDSEVSILNRLAGKEPVQVSSDTLEMLRKALHFGEVTNGAFDVTVGPLIALWRECAGEDRFPTEAEIQEALGRVGYRRIRLDERGQVRFENPGLRIDLGGIAKGYGVDLAYGAVRDKGFPDALVEAGGDLYAGGSRGHSQPWVVGIQDPRVSKEGPAEAVVKIPLSDRGVATSGHYRRYSMIQGKRVNHILDPRTGMPAEATASVTVVARDCTTADALATTVSVMGIQDGLKLIDSLPDTEALIMTEEDKKLRFHPSKGWEALGAQIRPDLLP